VLLVVCGKRKVVAMPKIKLASGEIILTRDGNEGYWLKCTPDLSGQAFGWMKLTAEEFEKLVRLVDRLRTSPKPGKSRTRRK
jgi:hypothetical protein